MAVALATAIIGGASAVLSGTATLFKGATQGTAECGARPLFTGKKRDEWEQCVKDQQNINYELLKQEQKDKRTAVFFLGSVALIIVIILVLRNK